jgi:glutaredoxin
MYLSGFPKSDMLEIYSIIFIAQQHIPGKEQAMFRFILLLTSFLIAFTAISFAGEPNESPSKQTLIAPSQPPDEGSPLVVIYTLSTCPHCMEAKEYLSNNKIPFINREVDTDDEHMATLMKIYDSMGVPEQKRGVPFFIIGNRIKIQGFNKEKLQNAIKEVSSGRK